jgi:hypothetical protein
MITSIEIDEVPFCDPALLVNINGGGNWLLATGHLFDGEDAHMGDYLLSWNDPANGLPAHLDFIFMEWNDETDQDEGAVVSMQYRTDPEGAGFQLIDGRQALKCLPGVTKVYTRDDIREWVPMQHLIQQTCRFLLANDDRFLLVQTAGDNR